MENTTQHFESVKNMVQTSDGNIHLLGSDDITSKIAYAWNHQQVRDYCAEAESHGIRYSEILYTTDPTLQGVKQLKRELFVRGVDVEELAREFVLKIQGHTADAARKQGFVDGYNAKKGEFTREETEQAMWDAMAFVDSNPKASPKDISDYVRMRLDSLSPLSLPQSLTIENDVITKINW